MDQGEWETGRSLSWLGIPAREHAGAQSSSPQARLALPPSSQHGLASSSAPACRTCVKWSKARLVGSRRGHKPRFQHAQSACSATSQANITGSRSRYLSKVRASFMPPSANIRISSRPGVETPVPGTIFDSTLHQATLRKKPHTR